MGTYGKLARSLKAMMLVDCRMSPNDHFCKVILNPKQRFQRIRFLKVITLAAISHQQNLLIDRAQIQCSRTYIILLL